jgi:hypothetical protein
MESPSFNGKPKASASQNSCRSRNAVAFGLPLNDPIQAKHVLSLGTSSMNHR